MTTEEKAKAYEMALEAARKELGVDRKEWEVVQRVLHNIFPELAESEDERIRKWLIQYVRDTHPIANYWNGAPTISDVLAWLEKQKEQVMDETDKIAAAYQLGRSDERKQKEPKPVEWSDYKDKIDIPYCSSEQEWSEEDEKMLKCCLIAINHYEKTCNIGDHLPTKFNIDGYLLSVDKVKSWLKSLRPQKKEDLPKWRKMPPGYEIRPANVCSIAVDVLDVNGKCVGQMGRTVLQNGNEYLFLDDLEKLPKEDEK